MPKDDLNVSKPPAKTAKRQRLSRSAREQQIIEEAVRYFAEVGFGGQTRDLARRLGISQSLLFRYFPTKDAIIARVYQEVYVQRWNPDWEDILQDRDRPLGDRLVQFYQEYTAAIFEYEWVRIFVFSGITGVTLYQDYIKLIRDRVLKRVCVELRDHCDLPGPAAKAITQREIDLAWGLHGSIFYIAIRKFIYGYETRDNFDQYIQDSINTWINGIPDTLSEILSD